MLNNTFTQYEYQRDNQKLQLQEIEKRVDDLRLTQQKRLSK